MHCLRSCVTRTHVCCSKPASSQRKSGFRSLMSTLMRLRRVRLYTAPGCRFRPGRPVLTFLVVCCICGIQPALERARLQSAAVSEIAGTSGCPVYDYALPVPQWCVDVFGPHLFGTVTSLSWFEWGVFPPDSVENHRNYAAVGKLPALTTITIFDSAFPIDVLPRCRALKRLEIIRNGLRDADMTIICRLSGLQSLSLAENDITAVGVEQLSRLQNLRELDLSGNLISPEALTLLQKRLPQCQITCTWSRISECGSNSTAQHSTVEHSTGRHDAD